MADKNAVVKTLTLPTRSSSQHRKLKPSADLLRISTWSRKKEIEEAFRKETEGVDPGSADFTTKKAARDAMLQEVDDCKRKTHHMVCGNPGVGKSTLLNSLIGDVAFPNGLSLGEGKTKEMVSVERQEAGDVNVFVDTPGLADVRIAKQAIEAINKALQIKQAEEEVHKVLFVMTLEAGRLRPQEVATINMVLKAAPDIGHNYAIIINKLSKRCFNELFDPANRKVLENMFVEFAEGVPHMTKYITAIEVVHSIMDEDNCKFPVPEHLREFIARLPVVAIDPKKVTLITEKHQEAAKEETVAKIERARANPEEARKKAPRQVAEAMESVTTHVKTEEKKTSPAEAGSGGYCSIL